MFAVLLLALLACGGHSEADESPVDDDGDGLPAAEDCDDAEASVHQGATERCDGLDNDCDGVVDEVAADAPAWRADTDGDGFGNAAVTVWACTAPTGFVADDTDCDDTEAATYPGAAEPDCTDPTDYNCDGSSAWSDADTDGWAACQDCDDAAPAVHPAAEEACNGLDDDCDGLTDDDDDDVIDPATWYADDDDDGYGTALRPTAACETPLGFVADSADCDDSRPAVNPSATELCNGLDDDCNTLADDDDPALADPATWYADADADGYGSAASTSLACSAPLGTVADATDCDDADADSHPGGDDLCDDGLDQDCSGTERLCFAAGDYGAADAFAVIQHPTAGTGFSSALTALGDTNGDGLDDILLLDADAGYVFNGPLSGTYTPADAAVTISGDATSDDLDIATKAGDVDGDGYADLLLGGSGASPLGYTNEGGVWLLYGPLSGASTVASADAEIAGGADGRFLRVADGLGDVNGDGFADVAASSWGAGTSTADRAGLYYGPLTGNRTLDDADVLIQGDDDDDGLGQLHGGEDLDGDGIGDYVVGAPFDDTTAFAGGAVYVVLGPLSSGTIDTLYDYRYTGDSTNEWFGTSVQALPDLDGDGFGELVAGAYFEHTAALVYGGGMPASGRISTRYDALITGSSSSIADRNGQPRSAGDLDEDGDAELIVSDPLHDWAGTDEGVVGLFEAPLGSLTVLDAEVRIAGTNDSDGLSRGTAAGDLDGDGLGDLLLSLPGDDAGGADAGAVWLFGPR